MHQPKNTLKSCFAPGGLCCETLHSNGAALYRHTTADLLEQLVSSHSRNTETMILILTKLSCHLFFFFFQSSVYISNRPHLYALETRCKWGVGLTTKQLEIHIIAP